jgi:peptidyl-prolyl cis-trans isomerase B (cyclophilin B)
MRLLLSLLLAACLLGCKGAPAPSPSPAPAPRPSAPSAPPAAAAPAPAYAPPTAAQIAAARKEGPMKVTLTTDKGDIVLQLDGAAAPETTANFENLVKSGFYDGLAFHRVEPGFVIQAGNPVLTGRPPVTYTIPEEKSPLKHIKGALAMALLYRGGQKVPNSASTEFYITLAPTPHLDPLGFTVFGKVVAGMDVVEKIAKDDVIRKATLSAPEK